MDWSAIGSLRAGVSQITDVRVVGRGEHLLIDVVEITILAVLCGANDFVAVETFAIGRRVWLRQFFELPNGLPAHDTFSRGPGLIAPPPPAIFGQSGRLDRRAATDLEGACHRHRRQVLPGLGKQEEGPAGAALGQRVAHRSGTDSGASGRRGEVERPIQAQQGTVLPELLELLSLKGALVTIDAMGTQKAFETRFYLSSLPPDAKLLSRTIRSHWGSRTRCIGRWT